MSVVRGNYYRNKTRKWLEAQGYTVRLMEHVLPFRVGRKKMFRKVDYFGMDLMAMNGKEILYVNSVFGPGKVKAHLRGFMEYPYPPTAKCLVIEWPKARAKQPNIHEVKEIDE